MDVSPSARTSIRSGASAFNRASTSRLRPKPRMRVAPIPSASNVAPTPSVPVMPLIAIQLPPPRRHVRRESAERISHELAYRMRKEAEITLESSCFAEQRFARPAIRTHAARQPRIDVNTITHGHVGDLTPDFHDDSGGVEPNTGGKRRQMIPQPAAENRVHVRNDAGCLHLNQHVARTRLWNFHRIDPQWLSRLMKTCNTH